MADALVGGLPVHAGGGDTAEDPAPALPPTPGAPGRNQVTAQPGAALTALAAPAPVQSTVNAHSSASPGPVALAAPLVLASGDPSAGSSTDLTNFLNSHEGELGSLSLLADSAFASSGKQKPGDFCHVTVRLRPLSPFEISMNSYLSWDVEELVNRVSMTPEYVQRTKRTMAEYYFDSAVSGSENKIVYEKSVKGLVKNVMAGYHGTVFAYGQTASGKTYTMMGVEEQPGIIPQAIDDVFRYIRDCPNREFLLRVSYLEIYNETLRDLLAPEQADLRIHEDRRRGVYVSPLKENIVTTAKQVLQIIQNGEVNRHFGTTDYNERSSRSHTIFTMVIESRARNPNQEATSPARSRQVSHAKDSNANNSSGVTISQLNLIDLAGSEKATTDLERRKEGAFINKSLLTLGNVISKLTQERGGHVPYRDSKLTRILQSSLSGNAKISVICTVSPGHLNAEETHNTLKFATRVKRVAVRAHMNEILDDKALLQKYRKEIAELRMKLAETNQVLNKEKERELQILREERHRWEEEMEEQQLLRTALKERIEHLTKLILTSSTINHKAILEWTTTPQGNRNATNMDGLLPSSMTPLGANPKNGNISQSEGSVFQAAQTQQVVERDTLVRSQRAEIDLLSSRLRHMEDTFALLKGIRDTETQGILARFEARSGRQYQDLDTVRAEAETLRRRNQEMEIVLQEQEEKLQTLERLANETKMAEMNTVMEDMRETIDDLESENRTLKNTITDLKTQIRRLEIAQFERTERSALGGAASTAVGLASPGGILASSPLSAFPRSAFPLSPTVRTRQSSAFLGEVADGSRIRELEHMLEKERTKRADDQGKATERISALEAELTIQRLESNVKHILQEGIRSRSRAESPVIPSAASSAHVAIGFLSPHSPSTAAAVAVAPGATSSSYIVVSQPSTSVPRLSPAPPGLLVAAQQQQAPTPDTVVTATSE